MVPEINLVDPEFYASDGTPHSQLAWLRQHSPVFWHAEGGRADWDGFWAVTTHHHIERVSRSPQAYSSHRRLALFSELPEDVVNRQRLMMINMDPPQHTRQRNLVNRMFTPRIIDGLEERIRRICTALLDEVSQGGEIDFVRDIAAPLPLYVLCELIGIPEEDRDYLLDISRRLVIVDDPDVGSAAAGNENDAMQDAAAQLYVYASDLAERHRATRSDEILTRLLSSDERGESLTSDEFYMFILMLTIAGTETTTCAASGGILAFFEHPDQWQRLLGDPDLIPTAAEEIIRWVSPVNLFRRTAMSDTELGGQPIAEGDKVVVFYSSANRDETVFTNPATFDIGRAPNPHLGFGGGGPHFCLGRHLAVLELRVLFEELAMRMPDISLNGQPCRLRSSFVNGIKQMPVRFKAQAARC